MIDSEGDGLKSTKGSLAVTGGTVEAFGDRGLKAGEDIVLDGCTLLATATDNACENLSADADSYIQASFVKEWSKNNPIALTDSSGDIVFNINTRKKYRYALVYSPELNSGSSYQLGVGGIQVEQGGKNSFRTGADYTGVNNTDHADLLYKKLYDKTKVHKIDVLMEPAQWQEFLSHLILPDPSYNDQFHLQKFGMFQQLVFL